jgi:hypothetical protein
MTSTILLPLPDESLFFITVHILVFDNSLARSLPRIF